MLEQETIQRLQLELCRGRPLTGVLLRLRGGAMADEALDNFVALRAVMFDAAPEPLVGVDSDGRIICWNGAAERTFGYDRTQATGQFLIELIVPTRLREGHLRGFGRTNRTPGQELP